MSVFKIKIYLFFPTELYLHFYLARLLKTNRKTVIKYVDDCKKSSISVYS